ncbi:MAG: hypothetical protein NZ988_06065 [Thaumarchaeota archaeon]|nr:hypothetical protein [Candidatus Calditenuaceae archaeon]MDW8187589.1 hypothetical protein [Nitrososphaerota archaeon]
MTEYLILGRDRASPLIWEFQRQVTTPSQQSTLQVNVPQSDFTRNTSTSGANSYNMNSMTQRIFVSFTTPQQPTGTSGIVELLPPRLMSFTITSSSVGNPQFATELWTVASNVPASKIQDLGGLSWSASFSSAPVLNWNTTYAIVVRPVSVNATNYGVFFRNTPTNNVLTPGNVGVSSNSGSTWTVYSGQMLHENLRVVYAIRLGSWEFFINRPNEAANYYLTITRPSISGITHVNEYVNDSPYDPNTPTNISGRFYYSWLVHTSSSVNTNITVSCSYTLKYEKNLITVEMFNAAEAYLSKIDFLASGTNTIQLNDNPDQIFSGNGGTTLTFDPLAVFWKAEVIAGRVRLTMMVFE